MRKLFVLVGVALTAVLAMSSAAAARGTPCNTTLTDQHITGDLVVPENGSCTIVNSTVGDDVKVGKNAYFQSTGSRINDQVVGDHALTVFIDTGSTVGGELKSWGSFQVFAFNSTFNDRIEVSGSEDKVQLCGNTIDGSVRVQDSGRDILIGDPKTAGCAGNTVHNGSSMRVEGNSTDVELVIRGNTFQGDGDLRVNDNHGSADKFVQDNSGGREVDCVGNEQPFTASGNTGWQDTEAQCAEI